MTIPLPLSAQETKGQRVARGALALALIVLGVYTLQNFLPALVWAAIFAVALWPLYRRCRTAPAGQRHTDLVPLAFTVGVALIFIVPLVLIGVQLAREAHSALDWLQEIQDNGIPEPGFLHRLPFGEPAVTAWWHDNLSDPGDAKALFGRLTRGRGEMGRNAGQQVIRRLTLFAFTLVTLFFLFREAPSLIAQLRRASTRTFGPHGERVARQMIASIHGTVSGLVLVGLGEGVILGVVYAIAGVTHPTLFGALTAFAAMVPFAAPVVFAVVAVLLAAQSSIVAAIVVFAIGLGVTFTADHFVRPVLIGGATQLPFLWVLLGILGGVEEWGLLGLFVGPAIMSALILLWRDYAEDPA